MVDFILVIILIIVLFMVYKQMSCFDELIESIEYPTILIIYDDQYQIAKKYENDTIKCIPKQEIYHFEQSYQYVILCCEDDYYNLLMNYRIHRDMLDVQVYSLIGKQKYEELYQENIELLQTIEDIERLIKHLYDQKKNKCLNHCIRICNCYFSWNVFTFVTCF